jgi:hypothetical protein
MRAQVFDMQRHELPFERLADQAGRREGLDQLWK